MKGCRGLLLSTFIFNISHSFASIALQLLLLSYINQALCGKPAGTILLPSAGQDGEGTRCINQMRDTLPPKHSFDEQATYLLPSLKKQPAAFGPRALQRQEVDEGRRGRRGLMNAGAGAIGSTPPKCVSKCGKCSPCRAVRVPIQPGRTKVSLMEYYPEAWRCKCKNKLYMP